MDRLQEIKERHNSSINSFVDGNDIDWLIEQAEKVEKQQKEIEYLRRKEYQKQQEDIHDGYVSDIMASIRFD